MAVLKQKNNAPKEVAQQVCIIYAVTKGYLAKVALEKVPAFEQELETLLENRYYDVLEAIRTTGKLEAETEARLKEALDSLLPQYTA